MKDSPSVFNEQRFDAYLESHLLRGLDGAHAVDELSRTLLRAGGQRLRSRLTMELAQIMNVPEELALPWAAANELLHTASLIHDDIQDRDLSRRGRPTLWSEHGVEVAISTGDYLLMKPFGLINNLTLPAEARCALQAMICDAVSRMAVAQVKERLLLEKLGDADGVRPHYLEVISGKTSALFELPVAGLSLMAGQDASERARVIESFRRLGQYFQILDDLKDVLGLKGKPDRGEDLREGKVSALVSAYVDLRPERASSLSSFLSLPARESAAIAQWLTEFEDAGAIEATWIWLEKVWAEFEAALPHRYGARGLNRQLSALMGPERTRLWRVQ